MSKISRRLNFNLWYSEFRDDNLSVELEAEIENFCVVTGEVADAGMSTVTMGNGQEGVMYNTLGSRLNSQ